MHIHPDDLKGGGTQGTWFALFVLLATVSVGAQEGGQPLNVIQGRLVLEAGERPDDWRILAAPHLLAEWPRQVTGLMSATTPTAYGTFTLQCERTDWVYVGAYVNGRLDVESVVPIPLKSLQGPREPVLIKPKPPREKVEFVLQREGGALQGRRVKVHLYNLHGEVTASTRGRWSDEAGIVRFERLPATYYDLWLEGEASTTQSGQERLPAVLFRNLEVTPGPGTQRITLNVPPSGSLRGRLFFPQGETQASGYVVAVQTGTVPEEGRPVEQWPAAYARGAQKCYAQTEVGPDGTFTLQGLTPGRLALDIRRPGEREAWGTIWEVEVKAGQVTNLGLVRVAREGWRYMFDRQTLAGWKESDFYDPGAVRIENDSIVMEQGNDMTGITWTQDLPRVDYEVTLQAMRVAGSDFFCGLTFPVKQDPCTLILGGWGGSVVGLSCLDGYDASENETSQWIEFDPRRWYRVRLRVTQGRIEVWLEQKRIINVDLAGKEVSIRIECEPSRPFGIATWRTTGAVRDLRIRRLEGKP